MHHSPRIGTAGWSIPPQYRHLFPDSGSHLERYAQIFNAVEINSSFYRPHRPSTYARWQRSVPAAFMFAVKMPKAITHIRKLRDVRELVKTFIAEISHLDEKLGPVLVQLPPSLTYEASSASRFFDILRTAFSGDVVCEPRHLSWFTPKAGDVLETYDIGRVGADPAMIAAASRPIATTALTYHRLHGSPKIYYSPYTDATITHLAGKIVSTSLNAKTAWCIFDNTALGEATQNAYALKECVSEALAHP